MIIIKSDTVPLHGAAISMIGGRPENQDDMAYLDTPLGFLIIVCDGMGGGPGGKTASYIVKHEIAETIYECSQQIPRDHALKMAVARAHQALEDKMIEDPALNGMGSTFVAVLINSQSAVIAHAGDSRCYRLHGKKCLFRTQDHSLVAELVRKKVMNEEEARRSPQANVITRGLGSTNNHVPEIEEMPYKKGDRFVICTDGVWGAMQHQKLLKVFTQPIDQQKLLADLSAKIDNIGFAKGGGHDNHTIAMFELEKDSRLIDSLFWKKWAMISSIAALVIALICFCLWAVLRTDKSNGFSISRTTTTSSGIPSYSDNSNYPTSSKTMSSHTAGEGDSGSEVHNESSKSKNAGTNADNGMIANGDENNQINEDARNLLLERMGRTDSVATQNVVRYEKRIAPNSIETVQKIINRYDSARVVEKKSIEEALKSLEAKKVEIKALFVDLSEQTKNSKTHQTVEIIRNAVDANHAWDIAKEPNPNTKLYVPTPKAKRHMENQIARLRELKESLEKEKE